METPDFKLLQCINECDLRRVIRLWHHTVLVNKAGRKSRYQELVNKVIVYEQETTNEDDDKESSESSVNAQLDIIKKQLLLVSIKGGAAKLDKLVRLRCSWAFRGLTYVKRPELRVELKDITPQALCLLYSAKQSAISGSVSASCIDPLTHMACRLLPSCQ
eukprot:Blabericola_migrator_1__1102@NODE_1281_length_4905_cov_291_882389_g865_i0_p4_GENE_NODE_1281_length_4905_cov_291_882389_g865_i0NODE_1281_length_4905_cov_291_882389_g865_i0_p4_ORF_typecomplete_len161_score27_95_NODE_1281_length_4905_cov_291_882389_g865_i040754557